MRLFISYSRKDEAIAHLLAHILESNHIECTYDRKLPPAQTFDLNLQNMIKEADIVLLLLTQSAVSSAWVNQEIGFATAIDKPVWPLAMEKDIQPQGFISATQSYSLFDWSNPTGTILKLVETLKQHTDNFSLPSKAFGLQQVIQGKISRAKFIVNCLREFQKSKARSMSVCNQAAFSIFCASKEPLYREAGDHSDEYISLLLEERKILNDLIDEKRILLKLILWPVRAYDPKYLSIRYKYLLEWMHSTIDNKQVAYVLAQYPGPNRYIFNDEFCIEGYKLHHTTGYQMSLVHYDKSKLLMFTGEFNAVFNQSEQSKISTVREVEKMYNKFSKLNGI